MKTRIIIVALIAALVVSTAQADTQPPASATSPKVAAKQSAVFVGSAVAGAILAGPVGYIAGGLTGAWLANNIGKADERDESVAELTAARRQIDSMSTELEHVDGATSTLERELSASRQSMDRYRRLASQYVSFELLFRTGESSLTPTGDERLNQLAVFLAEQPEIDVTLSGYADARGGDTFNMDLSEQRVRAVAGTLEANGVNTDRITVTAFGDQHSAASDGDLDAYALERRVTIELSVPEFAAEVAATAD